MVYEYDSLVCVYIYILFIYGYICISTSRYIIGKSHPRPQFTQYVEILTVAFFLPQLLQNETTFESQINRYFERMFVTHGIDLQMFYSTYSTMGYAKDWCGRVLVVCYSAEFKVPIWLSMWISVCMRIYIYYNSMPSRYCSFITAYTCFLGQGDVPTQFACSK